MKENEKLFGKMSSHLAEYDYLTGLPNRRGLYEFYDILESKDSIHAMFIDIDNFKRVNDIYGHSMGDELLICIAKLIEENVSGFTSRIGGDEFVALIDGNMTEDELKSTAETLLRQMENIDFRKDILSNVSLSIGIVTRQRVSTMLDVFYINVTLQCTKQNMMERTDMYFSGKMIRKYSETEIWKSRWTMH